MDRNDRRFLALVGLLLVALAQIWLPAACQAAEPDARAQIRARYDAMTSAMAEADVTRYVAELAEEYLFHNKNGTVDSRAKTQTDITDLLKSSQKPSLVFEITDFSLKGNDAEVRQVQTFRCQTPPDESGVRHTIEARGTMIDTWKKTASGWKLACQREVSTTLLLDGKPRE